MELSCWWMVAGWEDNHQIKIRSFEAVREASLKASNQARRKNQALLGRPFGIWCLLQFLNGNSRCPVGAKVASPECSPGMNGETIEPRRGHLRKTIILWTGNLSLENQDFLMDEIPLLQALGQLLGLREQQPKHWLSDQID